MLTENQPQIKVHSPGYAAYSREIFNASVIRNSDDAHDPKPVLVLAVPLCAPVLNPSLSLFGARDIGSA